MSTRAAVQSLPATISPMLASLARQPFDSPDHLFELKWDGMRCLAFFDEAGLRLQSRNLKDMTPQFPELTTLPESIRAESAVLDGELVCFDKDGRPSLTRLRRRLKTLDGGRRDPGPNAHYVAFDILYLDGHSLMELPLVERKVLLRETLEPSELAQPCEFVEANGVAFFQATCDHGLEGIMAKARSGQYHPGKRTNAWLKIKRVRECDFVVGGYTFGGANQYFSSLLLGLHDGQGRLVYVGQVGTGLSRTEAKEVYARLERVQSTEPPFDNPPSLERLVHWCRPAIVCSVQYGEFTEPGLVQYPTFLSLVDDKSPADCKLADAPGRPSYDILRDLEEASEM